MGFNRTSGIAASSALMVSSSRSMNGRGSNGRLRVRLWCALLPLISSRKMRDSLANVVCLALFSHDLAVVFAYWDVSVLEFFVRSFWRACLLDRAVYGAAGGLGQFQ